MEINIKYLGYQAAPLIGPLVFSPLVAYLSIIELVSGVAMVIIGIVKGGNPIFSDWEMYKHGTWIMKDGGLDLAYSIFNFLTLGILAAVTWGVLEYLDS